MVRAATRVAKLATTAPAELVELLDGIAHPPAGDQIAWLRLPPDCGVGRPPPGDANDAGGVAHGGARPSDRTPRHDQVARIGDGTDALIS